VVFERRTPPGTAGVIASVKADGVTPNIPRYQTIVPMTGSFWSPPAEPGMYTPTSGTIPRPTQLLHNMWSGALVVYYTTAADAADVRTLAGVAATRADLNIIVVPWDSTRGPLPVRAQDCPRHLGCLPDVSASGGCRTRPVPKRAPPRSGSRLRRCGRAHAEGDIRQPAPGAVVATFPSVTVQESRWVLPGNNRPNRRAAKRAAQTVAGDTRRIPDGTGRDRTGRFRPRFPGPITSR
jgi:hypothetical protein